MYRKIKIVKVDSNYCDYLRKYDSRVSYNAGMKELRPYIGILFTIENCEYFAPLSSPKKKHRYLRDSIDLMKIKDGEYGVINFNNMIPVTKYNYKEFNLNKPTRDIKNSKRLNLLRNQLRWLTPNRKEIYEKSKVLYNLYKSKNLPTRIRERCCDFELLEIKCKQYNKKNNLNNSK